MATPERRDSPSSYRLESEWQPTLIGRVDEPWLADFLDGAANYFEMKTSQVAPLGTRSDSDLVCAPIRGEDENGYVTDSVSQFFVTSTPVRADTVPGVLLSRHKGEWHASPAICGDNEFYHSSDALLIQIPWISALHRLVRAELDPLLYFVRDRTIIPQVRAVQEVEVRVNYFHFGGASAFFSNPSDAQAWEIAASWSWWEVEGLSLPERIEDLETRVGSKIDSQFFGVILREFGLVVRRQKKRKARSTRRVSEPSPSTDASVELQAFRETEPPFDPTQAELRHFRDYSPEADAEFSFGGAPELNFDLHQEVSSRFPERDEIKSEDDLRRRLWWWKNSANWPPGMFGLFQDNWERSAFQYEFRARENGRNQWEPFAKPWVKLNNTQRGVLAALWPPEHVGRMRLRRNLHPFILSQIQSMARLHRQIDLNMPMEDFLAMMEEWFKEERRRVQALNIPLEGKKRQKQKWEVLELMDRAHYFRGITLSGDERAKITKSRRVYERACAQAGIEA